METGLFEIQVEHLCGYRRARQLLPTSRDVTVERTESDNDDAHEISTNRKNNLETVPAFAMTSGGPAVEFARCFLRLANLPNFALDRLSRYEASLWHRVDQILFALDTLDRRKPQERWRRFANFR
jgi:hypothetical protein